MIWEDNEVAMKPPGLLMETGVQQHIYGMHIEDLHIIKEAESPKMNILDADYIAADIPRCCKGHTHTDLEG
jgi:hypothetical protein